MSFAFLLSVVVVVYNNIVNRWGPFQGPAYLPLNLMFAAAVIFVAAATLGLSRAELGLQGDLSDFGLPLALVAMFAIGAFVLAGSRSGHYIADRRVVDLHGSALAFYVLVRIPLGTAVVEEVVFRGALFAAWRNAGASTQLAAVCASVAFGLWHVAPTIIGLRLNDPRASWRKLSLAVTGAILITTVAGLGLQWLRMDSGGLAGPIALHAGINSVGALAAVSAGRRAGARLQHRSRATHASGR
jgi:membrane protease YdiL (CAAX protease family)